MPSHFADRDRRRSLQSVGRRRTARHANSLPDETLSSEIRELRWVRCRHDPSTIGQCRNQGRGHDLPCAVIDDGPTDDRRVAFRLMGHLECRRFDLGLRR